MRTPVKIRLWWLGLARTIQTIPLTTIWNMLLYGIMLLIFIAFLISPILLSLLMPTGS